MCYNDCSNTHGGLEMKNVMKFKYQGKEGFLSFVEKDNVYYALVHKDTPKVSDIINTHKMFVSYELKVPVYQEVEAHIEFDQPLIAWVYHQLEIEGNLYFKELTDQLCVISIPQKIK
jgi:hypothetical protein